VQTDGPKIEPFLNEVAAFNVLLTRIMHRCLDPYEHKSGKYCAYRT